eukprot:1147935-Pelagomonas_calceolata.AAC.8
MESPSPQEKLPKTDALKMRSGLRWNSVKRMQPKRTGGATMAALRPSGPQIGSCGQLYKGILAWYWRSCHPERGRFQIRNTMTPLGQLCWVLEDCAKGNNKGISVVVMEDPDAPLLIPLKGG